jgi:Domain of unknown function (DUF4942)
MTDPSTTALAPLAPALGLAPGSPEARATATFLAKEYREATGELRRLMLAIKGQSDRLDEAFPMVSPWPSAHFDVSFEYAGHRERADSLDRIFTEMKRRAWRVLIDRMGIKNVMSIKERQQFEAQLEKGELPDIDEQAILDILSGLAGQAESFAQKAAKEVFDVLRPHGPWGGQYKTNDAFRVGRKVILGYTVERGYGPGKFRVAYGHEQTLTAIDGIFHLLDGKGIMRDNKGPLIKAINESLTGKGETEYFTFKCFRNKNLHLTFKRLDLVKELNKQGAGEYVLGDDPVGD